MSNLKISDNQHLGTQELNRFKKFLSDKGFKLLFENSIENYGIVRKQSDTSFLNLKVIPGSAIDKLTLKSGYAIDSNINIITVPTDQVDVLTTPTDSVIRYVIIKHAVINLEEGTVDIAVNGQLTGTGTLFTEVLRGAPNHPMKIKFPNSPSNTQEYEVNTVSSDTSAIIQGASFTAELGQQYQCIGTFTRGISVPPSSKNIYEYDYYEVRLDASPTVIAGEEFILASVVSDGVTTTISDFRQNYEFQLVGTDQIIQPIQSSNVLMGVESIKYDSAKSPKDENLLQIGFGFRSSNGNWTGNPITGIVQITSGNGGIFANTAAFTNGDFDGWRLYFNNGNYAIIQSSTILLGVITLNIGDYNTTTFPTSGDIVVSPDVDFVCLKCTDSVNPNRNRFFTFPSSLGYGIMKVVAGAATQLYYNHEKNGVSSNFTLINDGQYINETSFDSTGTLTVASYSNVVSGIFTAVLNVNNHHDKKAWLDQANTFTAQNDFNAPVNFNALVTATDEVNTNDQLKVNGELRLDQHDISLAGGSVYIGFTNTTNRVNIVVDVTGGLPAYIGAIANTGEGKILVITNSVSSTSTLQIIDEYPSGTPSTRIKIQRATGGNIILTPGKSATLIYQQVEQRWRVMFSNEIWDDYMTLLGDFLTLSSTVNDAWTSVAFNASHWSNVGGSITPTSSTIKYKKLGNKTTFISIEAAITIGAGVSSIIYSLPAAIASASVSGEFSNVGLYNITTTLLNMRSFVNVNGLNLVPSGATFTAGVATIRILATYENA